jgi:hypothetical protein
LDASFQKLSPQAHEASLSYLVLPKLDDEYGEDAADVLRDLVEVFLPILILVNTMA